VTDKAKLHTGGRLPALSPLQSEYTTSRGSRGVQHFRVYRLPQPKGGAFLLAVLRGRPAPTEIAEASLLKFRAFRTLQAHAGFLAQQVPSVS
jgi:hypothetical protein